MRSAALVLIGLCSIALSGCGSSGDDEPSATPAQTTSVVETTATAAAPEDGRLSRAEFAAKADAICGRQLRKLNQGPQPTSFAELAAAMDKGSRVLRATVKEIRALKPPEEDQRLVDQMLAAFEANAATLSTVKAAALRQDQAGVETAVALGEAPALRAGQLAYELDLTVCSQPQ